MRVGALLTACVLGVVMLMSHKVMAQDAAVDIVLTDDGALYVTQGGEVWSLVAAPITDEELAQLAPSGELDGVLPPALLGAVPAPRVVQATTDGTLFVVQGAQSWTLVPDHIADADLAALSLRGELDGTLALGGAAAPTPAPPAVIMPTPGAPTAPPVVIPTARTCYQFVAQRLLGANGGNPLPVVLTVYINTAPPATANVTDPQPSGATSGGEFNFLNVPGNSMSILDGTTLYQAPAAQLFVEIRRSGAGASFYLRAYSGLEHHLTAVEVELHGTLAQFGPADLRQPAQLPTSFAPLDAYSYKSMTFNRDNHSLTLTSASTSCALPATPSPPTPPALEAPVSPPWGFDWSFIEAFNPPRAWHPIGVVERGQTASFTTGSEIAVAVETDMTGTSNGGGHYYVGLDVQGSDGQFSTAGSPGCQQYNPPSAPAAGASACVRDLYWTIYPNMPYAQLQAPAQASAYRWTVALDNPILGDGQAKYSYYRMRVYTR